MVQQNKGSWQKENNPKTTSHGFSGGELFFLPIFPLLGTSKMRFTNNRLTNLRIFKLRAHFEKLIWRGFGQPVTYGPAASLHDCNIVAGP